VPSVPFAISARQRGYPALYGPALPTGLRLHLDRTRRREKAEEVNKKANFAENASASLLENVHPMIGRNVAAFTRSGWPAVRGCRTRLPLAELPLGRSDD